ncbi:NfeD family protein [Chloroflexota bacterium]
MKLILMGKKGNTKFIKRTVTDWLKVLVLLLDDAVALLVVILVLRFLKIHIPLPITIVIALLLGTFLFIIHKVVIPSFHRRIVTGPEGMIGAQGRVVELLNPGGAITVNGERWKAKSVDDNIEVDENVEIVELEGLTLKVKRKE